MDYILRNTFIYVYSSGVYYIFKLFKIISFIIVIKKLDCSQQLYIIEKYIISTEIDAQFEHNILIIN